MTRADIVCGYIAEHDRCTSQQIAGSVGLSVVQVRNALAKAREARRIVSERDGQIVLYSLARPVEVPRVEGPRQWWQV